MIDKDDGGKAFPKVVYKSNVYPNGDKELPEFGSISNDGMSLRDYFAAKALQGLLARPSNLRGNEFFTTLSYKFADAMLKARNK